MCGLVGRLETASDSRAKLLRAMNETIVHRGPDEAGFFEDDSVALAMRRLSIQDVSHGHQPARSESGDVVVMLNGEIYNVQPLRRMLEQRGHTLANASDTECIPHLYEEFGLSFVDHLRGMFVISLWDRRAKRLVLVRDRLGKKPLYWTEAGGGLVFGSEMKALLVDPAIPREADPVAINHYLTYQYVPAPWAAVRGVHKLPPAHLLVRDESGTRIQRYWSLDNAPVGTTAPDDRELVEQLRERLLDAVKVRMISERPLGAFLSGGLDSSAVVAAMHKIGASDIRTFSIGFDEETHNELPYARRVAQRYGTQHEELVVRPEALDVIPRLARSFDEPYADSSAIPSWYLANMTRRHVVVALNGDGGDETLGGYMRYLRYMTTGGRRLPRPVAQGLSRAGTTLRRHSARSPYIRRAASAATLLGEVSPADRYARFLSYFRPEEKLSISSPGFAQVVRAHDSYALVRDLWDRHSKTDIINRLLAVDTHSYLPGDLLPKVDITTMSVSLEARSPFLDHEFVEWAATIPGNRKIVGRSGKHLLKLALAGWIDDDLIHRRKQGFGIPLDEWLRGPLRPMVYDLLTDATARGRGYFDPVAVQGLIDEHMSGVNRASHLYALLMLELWHREVLAS
jgi:asparagine synthase (glutamine-hydrolysing)